MMMPPLPHISRCLMILMSWHISIDIDDDYATPLRHCHYADADAMLLTCLLIIDTLLPYYYGWLLIRHHPSPDDCRFIIAAYDIFFAAIAADAFSLFRLWYADRADATYASRYWWCFDAASAMPIFSLLSAAITPLMLRWLLFITAMHATRAAMPWRCLHAIIVLMPLSSRRCLFHIFAFSSITLNKKPNTCACHCRRAMMPAAQHTRHAERRCVPALMASLSPFDVWTE